VKKITLLLTIKISICICISLIGLELMSYLIPNKYYEWEYRYMYLSRGAIRNVGNRYWTYTPGKLIRSVTGYSYPTMDPVIEGDVYFKANNLGFAQLEDASTTKKSIAIFGDSYTEGSCREPWFWKLENELLTSRFEFQLLNFGLQGTGPQTWGEIFKDYHKSFNIEKVLIVFIGADFRRRSWVWDEDSLSCLESRNCFDPGVMGIDISLDHDQINVFTKIREQNRYGASVLRKIDGFFRHWSNFYRLTSSAIKLIANKKTVTSRTDSSEKTIYANLLAIKKIVEKLGVKNVFFLAVSQRIEAEQGRFNKETERIIKDILQIVPPNQVYSILLKKKDFLKFDGHPRSEGYEKIENKVTSIINTMSNLSFPPSIGLSSPELNEILGLGWYGVEHSLVWSGICAEIRLPVATECEQSNCSAKIKFVPFAATKDRPVTIMFTAADKDVAWKKTLVVTDSMDKEVSIPLPAGSSYRTFSIEVPQATSPSALSINQDSRILGIGLKEVTFENQ